MDIDVEGVVDEGVVDEGVAVLLLGWVPSKKAAMLKGKVLVEVVDGLEGTERVGLGRRKD